MNKKRIKRQGRKKKEGQGFSVEELLRFLKEEDRPLLLREILRRLGLGKEQRPEAREYLKDLADQGKVVRIRGNRYGLPSKMNLVVGRVKTHPDGYGFVIP